MITQSRLIQMFLSCRVCKHISNIKDWLLSLMLKYFCLICYLLIIYMTSGVFLVHLLTCELQNSIFVFHPLAEANTTKPAKNGILPSSCWVIWSETFPGKWSSRTVNTTLSKLPHLSTILQFHPSSKYSGDFIRFYSRSFFSVTRFCVSQFHQTQTNNS